MAKKRTSSAVTITADRAARLFRFVVLLGKGPQRRETLIKRLKNGVRGFYRDLDAIRKCGITVHLERSMYSLTTSTQSALDMLPFPDPELTLGEAEQLAKGRTKAHAKLKQQIDAVKSSKAKRPSRKKR